MGWFDESDDDDDDDDDDVKEGKKQLPASNKDDDEDDEDPLDAYMKSIHQAAAATTSTAKSIQKGRMDMQDDDEDEDGYEHFQCNQEQDDDKDDEDNVATEAKQSLATKFHKEGTNNNNNKSVDITLPRVQHNQISYRPFSKVFWTPTESSVGISWRKEHAVVCTPNPPDPIESWDELRHVLPSDLREHLQSHFTQMTLVQMQTFAVALTGKDSLITASTGSGKTLAYLLPLLLHVREQTRDEKEETAGPLGLVLVPTRELALQVQQQTKLLTKCLGLKVMIMTGGMQTGRYHLVQQAKEGGVDVIVATPGRLLDILSVKKGITLHHVTMVILDEADEMLKMGFESQVRQLLQNIRPDRQSLMLSATMNRRIENVAQQWLLPDVVRISIGRTGQASEHVTQHVMVLPNKHAKRQFVVELLPTLVGVGRTLIFVATREGCEELATLLRSNCQTVALETLHGDKHQMDRTAALKAFVKGNISALVATDVAARGLDIPQVSTVLCFDPAKNLDQHVHRIGRAGRLSQETQQTGTAYTLLMPTQAKFAHTLQQAFQREGQVVSPQLAELASKIKNHRGGTSRTHWNKSGLGFQDEQQAEGHHSKRAPPASQNAVLSPAAKRSRWS